MMLLDKDVLLWRQCTAGQLHIAAALRTTSRWCDDTGSDTTASTAASPWSSVTVWRPCRTYSAPHDDTTAYCSAAFIAHSRATSDAYAQSTAAGNAGTACRWASVCPDPCNDPCNTEYALCYVIVFLSAKQLWSISLCHFLPIC